MTYLVSDVLLQCFIFLSTILLLSVALLPTLIWVVFLACQVSPVSHFPLLQSVYFLYLSHCHCFSSFPIMIFSDPISHISHFILHLVVNSAIPNLTSTSLPQPLEHSSFAEHLLFCVLNWSSSVQVVDSSVTYAWVLSTEFLSSLSSAHGGLPPTPTAGVPCPPTARHGHCGQTNQALGQLLWGWNPKDGCVSLWSGH